MRKRFTAILWVILICLPIFAQWEVLPETDEFKDPLNIYRLTNMAKGTYDKNKWETGDCTLHITLEPMANTSMIDKWDLMNIYLEVYEDDSLIPVNQDTTFQLIVKNSEGELYYADFLYGTNPYLLELRDIIPSLTKGYSKILITTEYDKSYVFEFNGNNFYESLAYIANHSITKNIPHGNYDEWLYMEHPTFVDNFFKAHVDREFYESMQHGIWQLSSKFKTENGYITATLSISTQPSLEGYTISYRVTPFTSFDDVFYFEELKPCIADKIQFKWNGNIKTFTNESGTFSQNFNITKETMISISNATSVEYTIYYTMDDEYYSISGSFNGNSLKKIIEFYELTITT